jgi:hypothetical protein
MMRSPRAGRLQLQPAYLAAGLSALLVVLQILLQAATARSSELAGQLIEQAQTIEANTAERERIEAERLASLQQELEQAQSLVAELEAALPPIGAPLDVYRRGYETAVAGDVTLLSLRHEAQESHETGVGQITIDTYDLQGRGGTAACLSWMARLQAAGGARMGLERILMQPADGICQFDALVVSGKLDEVEGD